MSAFISGHGEGAEGIGIKAGITLTMEWAFVPFAMMLAWQCVRLRWLAVPTGIVALASPAIAGWLFGWSTKTILDTMIPCAIVLALGYRAIAKPPANRAFARCARIVAVVGAGWIGAALVIDAVLGFFHLNPFKLYSASDAGQRPGPTHRTLMRPLPPSKRGSCQPFTGVPRNTPFEIIDKLNKEIIAALADPKINARLAELGSTPLSLSPADFGKLIADETEKWGRVIRAANIRAQ